LIDEGLRHTSSAVADIAPRDEVEKQYARIGDLSAASAPAGQPAIKSGAVIERRMVGPMSWAADASAVIVPVAVELEFAAGIWPGVRVVFLSKADKASATSWAGVEACAQVRNPAAPTVEPVGFTVVSRSDATDPHKSVISVRVSAEDAKSIAALSDGVWHPVVVPDGAHLCAPPQK
jgi:hypothetical protein